MRDREPRPVPIAAHDGADLPELVEQPERVGVVGGGGEIDVHPCTYAQVCLTRGIL